MPHVHGGPSLADDHMAELACATPETTVDVSAHDDAEPDAAADRDRDKVLDLPSPPVEALPDGERVHVVVHENGYAKPSAQQLLEGDSAPAEKR